MLNQPTLIHVPWKRNAHEIYSKSLQELMQLGGRAGYHAKAVPVRDKEK
jgi:hypothetical protein